MSGWPPGEAGKYTPILLESYDRGGWFHAAFDDGRLVGVAILDNRFIGPNRDQLQLKFLHVSRYHRSRGLGKQLFDLSAAEALPARRPPVVHLGDAFRKHDQFLPAPGLPGDRRARPGAVCA